LVAIPAGHSLTLVEASTRATLSALDSMADPSRKPGMERVGINTERALGVSIPDLRSLARQHRRDHTLALDLWRTRIHEARILASMIDDPALVTDEQMEDWVVGFDSWDICDQVCGNLFGATRFAFRKARAWTRRSEEFVKRAGFTLIAERAVHDRSASDEVFARFLPTIRRGATDERNYVKKAVSWSLRQIGKRNLALHSLAIEEAKRLIELDSRSARWVGHDAARELRSDAVRKRLEERA
jgi:3-methyladenine DNA glycosylase AlkD